MSDGKKKKIIIIAVLVLVMIVIGMSLNSCSNSVEEDKVVQKNATKKKTKSQDTTKVDEEKDESEIKQEEKKEETAKAESKKDNTASTSSNSNKNNSSSSSSKHSSKPSNSSSNNSSSSKPSNNIGSSSNNSKPAEHKHDWVAQYKTVNIPEKGHNEQVLVQAAYDEQVPITEMKEFSICNDCGADITGFASDHILNGTCRRYHSEWREVVTGYQTVHHDAVYETRYVVDSPATTKQELTGYKCSGCGKTRAN